MPEQEFGPIVSRLEMVERTLQQLTSRVYTFDDCHSASDSPDSDSSQDFAANCPGVGESNRSEWATV